MKKTKKVLKPHALELKKETVVNLELSSLNNVAGGIKTTILSQCPTLCFT